VIGGDVAMATVVGGFVGRLDQGGRLNDVIVHVPIPIDSGPFTARHFLIQTFEPPCDGERNGHLSALIEGVQGAMERAIYPQYEEYWTYFGLREEDMTAGRPTGEVHAHDIDLCRCIPELDDCDEGNEAVPLEIYRSVEGRGFIVTLNLEIDDLDPGTIVRGLVALDDVEDDDERNSAESDERQDSADAGSSRSREAQL
jgi:hypothetical protein